MGGWSGDVQVSVAIVAGLVVSVVLFVPFVAMSYRRGGLTSAQDACCVARSRHLLLGDLDVHAAAAAARSAATAAPGYNLDPLGFLPEHAAKRVAGGWQSAAPHRDVQQLVLNVALFTPLGFFLRDLARPGRRRVDGWSASASRRWSSSRS
jgi:hypothetical protein